jgi:TonB family protein
VNLKKTITISIVLHICFFSAAFLFSAGLLKGSGDISDQKVFFVSLPSNENQSGHEKIMSAEPESKVAKKEIKPIVVEKQKVVKAEVVIEKTEEPVTDETVIQLDQVNDKVESAQIDEEPVLNVGTNMDEGLNDSTEKEEIVQTLYGYTPPESAGSFTGTARAGLLPGTIELIGNAIERVKTYPVMARRRGIEGTVHVSFSINPNGRPHDIMVMKSSGFNILDKATVKVVKKAAPYPLIESRVEVPVAYRLKH